MALDLSADHLLIDDPLTVSYRVRTAENFWAAGVNVPYCQRMAVSKSDIERNGALLNERSTVFHLWRANLQAITPKKGDVIVFGGANWKIESVDELDRDANGVQRYRVVTTVTKANIP